MHLPLKNLSIGVAALALFTGLPEAWQQKAAAVEPSARRSSRFRRARRLRCSPASRSSA